MSNYHHYLFLCTMIVVLCYGSGCEEDISTPLAPCEWQIPQTPLVTDTCFDRTTTSSGQYVIPPTIGEETHLLAFDPTDEDYLYFTTWKRTGLGGQPGSEVFRWNLCENLVTSLGTSNIPGTGEMLLNSKGEILRVRGLDGIAIYDMATQQLVEETDLEATTIQRAHWASDSTIFVSHFAGIEPAFFPLRWVLFHRNGTPLDTLEFSSGPASDLRNGKTVFQGTNIYTYERQVYIYDHTLGFPVDSLPPPTEFGITSSYNNYRWLNDEDIVVSTNQIIAVSDFANQTYHIIKEYSLECDNQQIQSVAVVPNRPDEILYTLQYYFYSEAGEYRKRHDIVHLNIATGEEQVLAVE